MKSPLLVSLVFLFILQLPDASKAQENPPGYTYIQIDSTKQMWGDWAEPDWLRYFGLDAGDVDRDGNMDIVSGRYVYHNPGDHMESPWKRTVLDDNVDGILYLDVDGDPYADIIAMALPDLFWYEALNEEGTAYSRQRIGTVPATSHVNSQGFEKAQIIEGGPLEIVIAGNGNIYAVVIPEKPAAGQQWMVNLICENTSDEGIGVGDIDGDGDLDIAAGRRPRGEAEPKLLIWYENPGSADHPWKEISAGESEHPIDRIEVADVNGDGKADIIVTEERYPGLEPDANLWWYEQETLAKWKRHKIATQYSSNNLDISDIDADGDTDLLTAEHKGEKLELQLWYNDGNGNFSKQVLDTGKENHLGTQWVDLDFDGDLDIIGAGWDQHRFMHVWRNDKTMPLKSGMLFKDHSWTPQLASDNGKFLRVGGKLDYQINADHYPPSAHKNGFIEFDEKLDLKNATRAEIFVERVQSHEDTRELRIAFNNGDPLLLPEPLTIEGNPTDYMFHFNSRIPVPLNELKQGVNSFRLTVAEEQAWDWPQNLIYGLVLRVYYQEPEEEAPIRITGLSQGMQLADEMTLGIDLPTDYTVQSVDFIGFYEDADWQGDGKYLDWQYRYHRGALTNHIGGAVKAPFQVKWNTAWIPEQSAPIKIIALVKNESGFTRVSEPVDGLVLQRNYQVLLVKPYRQDPFWTTRNGPHTEYFDLPVEVGPGDRAKLLWNSWSPCYSNGLSLNGKRIEPDPETPCYDAYQHAEDLDEVAALKKGTNELTTLKTPLHAGKMVHGMDVQWPGIMLKLKQQGTRQSEIQVQNVTYEGADHFRIQTASAVYYYDKAGGGFSRIIDRDGNDWIGFKREPWGSYPASAASAFRGLPNLVFNSETDEGAGHPGHDKCSSKYLESHKIRSTSKSGHWQWEWTFNADYAVLEILEAPANTPYWFLYEGTPGGSYNPKDSGYATDQSSFTDKIPDYFNGDIHFGHFNWAYFRKKKGNTTFYLAQLGSDDKTDMMSYLGNTDKGAGSEDGMTVFGFGRADGAKPLLVGKNTFLIGLYTTENNDLASHEQIITHIENRIKTTEHNETKN